MSSLDSSLKRMGLEYVDIFYHHRMDKETPLEETMLALDSVVKSGKATYIGLSNYDTPTTLEASKILKELHCPFIINQNRLNIFDRTIIKNGFFDAIESEKKGLIVFSPLAQGMLSGRYLENIPEDSRIRTDGRFLKESSLTPERLASLNALNDIAKERGQTLAQMALSWIYRFPEVTSILIGASKPEQVLEDID
jgi:L-glyceraldehyde 3-phosphate reductase